MFLYSEDEEEDNCIYTPKYGYCPLNSKTFDDHPLLGEEYYKYKPERIKIWTSSKGKISGIQTFFKNIIDSDTINSGENKGSDSLDFTEFIINTNEYLNNCEIWEDNDSITCIVLMTNKGSTFSVGKKKGHKRLINHLIESKKRKKEKIIISFFGNYDTIMNGFGLHLMDKNQYLGILLTGYFELKYKLQKKEYKEHILNEMENKKFDKQEETIIKTCLMPSAPFNYIMKFCII